MTVVAVTGASGFIGSWVVKKCLEAGYTVHATVRNVESDSAAHLTKERLAPDSSGTLKLFGGCDLLKKGSFDEAFVGCECVMHTASPFAMGGAKDPMATFVTPALEGTRNVLTSVSKASSVKRVVLTSSIVAVYDDPIKGHVYGPEDWNTRHVAKTNGYSYSKTVAEREAWKMQKAQDVWTLSTINPGIVLGPSLSGRNNDGSFGFMRLLLTGSAMSAKVNVGAIHVSDVAEAHVKSFQTPNFTKRVILVENTYFMPELNAFAMTSSNAAKFTKTKIVLPKAIVVMFGWTIGLSPKQALKTINTDWKVDNSVLTEELGITPIPTSEAVVQMADYMVDNDISLS